MSSVRLEPSTPTMTVYSMSVPGMTVLPVAGTAVFSTVVCVGTMGCEIEQEVQVGSGSPPGALAATTLFSTEPTAR